MGKYINPGMAYFDFSRRDDFVDKSELIHLINQRKINTKAGLMLVSRPRRFGKTLAAEMLSAYYGSGYDARPLFEGLKIAKLDPAFTNLNSFNVLYLDISDLWRDVTAWQKKQDRKNLLEKQPLGKLDWIWELEEWIEADLIKTFGEDVEGNTFFETLEKVVEKDGKKFLWICDEWDLFFREDCPDPHAAANYIELLRGLFKAGGGYTQRVFAGAYLTGILPMVKIRGQSAVSDFNIFSMIQPLDFAPYYGFTEAEVKEICDKSNMDFEEMKRWYNGYQIGELTSLFNPKSVRMAVENRACDAYWNDSSSYESLAACIKVDVDGIRDVLEDLLRGHVIEMEANAFENNLHKLDTLNEILGAMVHLGYLTYDRATRTARIPNLEVRKVFLQTIETPAYAETFRRIKAADRLLLDTWRGNVSAVAEGIEKVHSQWGDPRHYNSEARLSEVVSTAYLTAENYYEKFYELGSGIGFIDMAFVPKPGKAVPPMVIELKWDKPAEAGLDQMKKNGYIDKLKGFAYKGEILLVAITYNSTNEKKDVKGHTCIIEKVRLDVGS